MAPDKIVSWALIALSGAMALFAIRQGGFELSSWLSYAPLVFAAGLYARVARGHWHAQMQKARVMQQQKEALDAKRAEEGGKLQPGDDFNHLLAWLAMLALTVFMDYLKSDKPYEPDVIVLVLGMSGSTIFFFCHWLWIRPQREGYTGRFGKRGRSVRSASERRARAEPAPAPRPKPTFGKRQTL